MLADWHVDPPENLHSHANPQLLSYLFNMRRDNKAREMCVSSPAVGAACTGGLKGCK